MTKCNHAFGGKLKSVWAIHPKYNYREKVWRAIIDKNYKYINMLIKKRKIIVIK